MNIKKKRKWSSTVVAVTALSVGGFLNVGGCEQPMDGQSGANEQRRNQYQTKAECVADYSEKECEPQARSNGLGFLFLGPMYMGNWRNQGIGAFRGGGGPGRTAMASPTGTVAHPTQTTRGGFGATGRSYSNRGG
jgi:hypothetical protein